MKNKIFGLLATLPLLSFAKEPMNVIFILADDLGWSDTTLYGHTDLYETPNMERLAARGMTFTHAYANSAICSPTRASILTGWTPARHGITAPRCHHPQVVLEPVAKDKNKSGKKATDVTPVTRLDTHLPTLGKLVKQAGYATGHFGKWHLGLEPYSPLEHGFDVDVPHWPGPGPAGSYVAPWKYPDFTANFPKEHIEDRMAEEAVQWMKSVSSDQPFYMNYWMFSVHSPFDAKAELIEKYRRKIGSGDAQGSPVYAAMVESMDDAVGSLLDAVDAAGIADRTAIIFVSDNGGNMYDRIDGVSPTRNRPLRGGKCTPWEGGLRVPCVVVWPGVAEPGSRSDEVIQTSDFYPTILDLLNVDIPKDHPVDGMDITPALRGGQLGRDAIYTYFPYDVPKPDWLPPSAVVHSGDWKLIRLFYEGENGADAYRLYNLKEDLGETEDLSAMYPERVKDLDWMLQKYLDDSNTVLPEKNPNFDPKQYHPEYIGLTPEEQAALSGAGSGWTAVGACVIEHGSGGLLRITSTGDDPYIKDTGTLKLTGGPFDVSLRIRSDSAGSAAFYFNESSRATKISFPMVHDNQWHVLTISVPVQTLTRLRIDPSSAPGVIELDWVRVWDADGNLVREWAF